MRRRPAVGASAVATLIAGVLLTGVAPAARAAQAVTVTGTVQVLDSVGGPAGHRGYVGLTAGHRSWRLRLPSGWALPTGTVIRTTGLATADVLTAGTVTIVSAPAAVPTGGTQSVYVIRAAWSANPSDGMTATALSTAFQRVSDWFDEVSYAHLPAMNATVDPTYETINAPSGGCAVPSGTNDLYTKAVAAAETSNATFDPADYDHVVIYFPVAASGCSFAGLGQIAGNSVWLNGDITDRVTTHELGHNLGLFHSHAPICHGAGSAQATIAAPGSCDALDSTNEYGDPADVMGGTEFDGHYSAAQKAQLGWLGAALSNTTPCAGSLALAPYETLPVSGAVAARISAGADAVSHQPVSYWLEYRQPAGEDGNAGFNGTDPLPAGITDGVVVHMSDPQPGLTSAYDIGPLLLDGKPSADVADADFTDAAISAGSVTTPEGINIAVTGHDGNGASVALTTTRPSIPTQTAVAVNGAGVRVSWNAPACVGTGGGSISGYHLTRVGGSTVDTTLTNATSPGLPGQAGAEYLVSATSGAGTGAAAVVPASAPAITGVDLNYTGAVAVTFNTSLSNGGRQILYYVVHADPVGGAPAIEDNYYDISTHSDKLWYLIAAAGDTYDVTILPLFSDFTFGPPSAPVRVTVEDQTAPHVTTTAPTPAVTLGSTTTARWSGSDSGGAGLKSYDVRYRHAAYSGHLGKTYVYPASWQATTSTSKSLAVARGSTYCFSVRARDNNLNTSSWSVEKCTATPLDDRSLVASSHWSRTTGTAYYAHTVTSSAHRRATLTRTGVNARHLAVLATRCAICGKVAVYADGTKVATLDLRGTTRNRLVFNVPLPHALSAATVRLKVVTRGKPVKIDGLVLRAV